MSTTIRTLEDLSDEVVEELRALCSVPLLGATNVEEYQYQVGWVEALKHVLRLIHAPQSSR